MGMICHQIRRIRTNVPRLTVSAITVTKKLKNMLITSSLLGPYPTLTNGNSYSKADEPWADEVSSRNIEMFLGLPVKEP